MHVTKTPLAGRKRRDPNTCVRNSNSCSETSLKHTGQGEGLLRVWQIGWVRPLLLSPPSENRAHVAQSFTGRNVEDVSPKKGSRPSGDCRGHGASEPASSPALQGARLLLVLDRPAVPPLTPRLQAGLCGRTLPTATRIHRALHEATCSLERPTGKQTYKPQGREPRPDAGEACPGSVSAFGLQGASVLTCPLLSCCVCWSGTRNVEGLGWR